MSLENLEINPKYIAKLKSGRFFLLYVIISKLKRCAKRTKNKKLADFNNLLW